MSTREETKPIPPDPAPGNDDTSAPVPEPISLEIKHHVYRLSHSEPLHHAIRMLSWAVPFFGFIYFSVLVGLGSGMKLIVMLGMVMAWVALRRRQSKKEAERLRSISLPPPLPNARLKAFGRADELEPLTSIVDVPFEPVICERSYPLYRRSFVLSLVIPMGFFYIAVASIRRARLPGSGLEPLLVMALAVGVFLFIYPWLSKLLYPEYYRVVPGRLDVLRAAMFRHRIWVAKRYDLRKAELAAYFDKGYLEIRQNGDEPVELGLNGVHGAEELVQAVFQAAVCTHPAPDLPDDALLG